MSKPSRAEVASVAVAITIGVVAAAAYRHGTAEEFNQIDHGWAIPGGLAVMQHAEPISDKSFEVAGDLFVAREKMQLNPRDILINLIDGEEPWKPHVTTEKHSVMVGVSGCDSTDKVVQGKIGNDVIHVDNVKFDQERRPDRPFRLISGDKRILACSAFIIHKPQSYALPFKTADGRLGEISADFSIPFAE